MDRKKPLGSQGGCFASMVVPLILATSGESASIPCLSEERCISMKSLTSKIGLAVLAGLLAVPAARVLFAADTPAANTSSATSSDNNTLTA